MSNDQPGGSENNNDIARLLQPISEQSPSGNLLRYEKVYDEIKEARRADDDLPRGIWEVDLKKSDWQKVAGLCQEILLNQSKDLQVAAWLTEAWLQMEELPGLTRGLELIRGLCLQYWPTLHPLIENDDAEFRMAPLEWINERLTEEVKLIKIVSPSDKGLTIFSWMDIHDANNLETTARRHKEGQKIVQQAETEGKPTITKINVSVTQTPVGFFKQLYQQTTMALQAIQDLETALFSVTPSDMPSFYRLRTLILEIQKFVRGQWEEDPLPISSVIEATSDGTVSSAFQLNPIGSRAEAYARLQHAAEFLLRTEPHSPAPYLVKRAVSWGGMTLTELFNEIIQEERDLLQLKQLLGVGAKTASQE